MLEKEFIHLRFESAVEGLGRTFLALWIFDAGEVSLLLLVVVIRLCGEFHSYPSWGRMLKGPGVMFCILCITCSPEFVLDFGAARAPIGSAVTCTGLVSNEDLGSDGVLGVVLRDFAGGNGGKAQS